MIDKNKICIVGKSTCKFCKNAMILFSKIYKQTYVFYDLLSMNDGEEIHQSLKTETWQATVPYIFIYGEFIGGYDDLMSIHNLGKLGMILRKECTFVCDVCGMVYCVNKQCRCIDSKQDSWGCTN